MGRRRKGRAVHGWLVVDKPYGMSSAAVVNTARRALDAQKAGHAGTLDPLATGLLAIAFGEATKTIPIAQEGAKTYRFTARLGAATTTDDAEGAIVSRADTRPDDAAIRAALTAFEGETLQVPPVFSAIKVDGERAYALARAALAGEDTALPELAPRPLTVHRIALTARPDPDHAEIEMTCAKGGYVRAVARDLGRMLGCGAHVSALRRTASGAFSLAQAISFESFERIAHERASADLLPVATGLDDIPALAVAAAEAPRSRPPRPSPPPRGWRPRAGARPAPVSTGPPR
ncbi:MAG: tRNA pseudouridine(55) synthase TruB, partial [Pseudomonadota bacterium]